MARLGNFDCSHFKKISERFQKALDERVIERWIKEFLLEMALRAKEKIKKRTPVDAYPNKTKGDLKENWEVGNVVRHGNSYIVEIFNDLEYASHVEYGYVTEDGKAWVEGKFMATISMEEIEIELPKFLEQKQVQLLKQILYGRS